MLLFNNFWNLKHFLKSVTSKKLVTVFAILGGKNNILKKAVRQLLNVIFRDNVNILLFFSHSSHINLHLTENIHEKVRVLLSLITHQQIDNLQSISNWFKYSNLLLWKPKSVITMVWPNPQNDLIHHSQLRLQLL